MIISLIGASGHVTVVTPPMLTRARDHLNLRGFHMLGLSCLYLGIRPSHLDLRLPILCKGKRANVVASRDIRSLAHMAQ